MQLAYRNLFIAQDMASGSRLDKRILPVFIHILLWLVFLSLPAMFRPRPPGVSFGLSLLIADIMEPPRWTNALFLLSIFYLNYFFAIPKLYMQRRYALLVLSVCACIFFFFVLNLSLMPDEVKQRPSGGFEALGNSFNLFMFLIVYASSFALCLYEQWQHTRQQMLNAQISFLKGQINPHFLFNTLNSIYSLTLIKSDKAPDAVVKLSGMMRYAVSDADHAYVSLSKEIEYISNYIDLQKLRLTDKVKISFDVVGAVNDKQIAPFLLIPFVENAFKYGVNSEEDSDICIRIYLENDHIQLDVKNNKVYLRPGIERGTGLGIQTTRQRLEMLYPVHFSLSVADNASDFDISLKIKLA